MNNQNEKLAQKVVEAFKKNVSAEAREHISESDYNVLASIVQEALSLEMAEAAMEMNFYISFSGIVTFNSAADLKEVARRVPLERMLIETDSPYLAPVPYRGKPNIPSYVGKVAECVAELRGISVAELAAITSRNFKTLFLEKH